MAGDVRAAGGGEGEELPRGAFRSLPDFVQRLGQEMGRADLASVADESTLEAEVTRRVRSFVQAAFEGQKVSYAVWSRAEEAAALEEVALFGTGFEPAVAVDVDGVPCIGIEVALVRAGQEPAEAVARVLGHAFVHSRAYPAVLAFVYNLGLDDPLKHPFDREVELELWSRHKVRIIVRSGPR